MCDSCIVFGVDTRIIAAKLRLCETSLALKPHTIQPASALSCKLFLRALDPVNERAVQAAVVTVSCAQATMVRTPLSSENLLLTKLPSRTIVDLVHFCRAEGRAALDRFEPHIEELANAEVALWTGGDVPFSQVECLLRRGLAAAWCVCQRCKLQRLKTWHPVGQAAFLTCCASS